MATTTLSEAERICEHVIRSLLKLEAVQSLPSCDSESVKANYSGSESGSATLISNENDASDTAAAELFYQRASSHGIKLQRADESLIEPFMNNGSNDEQDTNDTIKLNTSTAHSKPQLRKISETDSEGEPSRQNRISRKQLGPPSQKIQNRIIRDFGRQLQESEERAEPHDQQPSDEHQLPDEEQLLVAWDQYIPRVPNWPVKRGPDGFEQEAAQLCRPCSLPRNDDIEELLTREPIDTMNRTRSLSNIRGLGSLDTCTPQPPPEPDFGGISLKLVPGPCRFKYHTKYKRQFPPQTFKIQCYADVPAPSTLVTDCHGRCETMFHQIASHGQMPYYTYYEAARDHWLPYISRKEYNYFTQRPLFRYFKTPDGKWWPDMSHGTLDLYASHTPGGHAPRVNSTPNGTYTEDYTGPVQAAQRPEQGYLQRRT